MEEYSVKLITTRLLVTAAALVLGATFAAAAGDDTIKARQACMKAQGASLGALFPILKGEKPYDATEVKAAVDSMSAACADWSNFWSEDSMTSTTMKTRAKPEIWTDKAGFEAVGGTAYTALTARRAATDEASLKAALPAVGAACQGCHEKFQAPKE
jgi:cytochrome c556